MKFDQILAHYEDWKLAPGPFMILIMVTYCDMLIFRYYFSIASVYSFKNKNSETHNLVLINCSIKVIYL